MLAGRSGAAVAPAAAVAAAAVPEAVAVVVVAAEASEVGYWQLAPQKWACQSWPEERS